MTTKTVETKRLLSEFQEKGYLLLLGLLNREIIERVSRFTYAQFEAQKQFFQSETGMVLDDCEAMKKYVASLESQTGRFETLSRDVQHLVKGELPLAVRLSQEFLAITEETALLGVLGVLLNDQNLRMHYPPMIRFKVPGQQQAKVPLHQDHPYFPHIEYFINVWIPLCPITEECGGVNVLEGSHRLGGVEHRGRALWGSYVEADSLRERYPDKHILMDLGDVLLFGPHLFHYTHENTSERVRCSIDSRWFASRTPTTRQYYDLQKKSVIKMF